MAAETSRLLVGIAVILDLVWAALMLITFG